MQVYIWLVSQAQYQTLNALFFQNEEPRQIGVAQRNDKKIRAA
jgi:hypothetical protein